MFPASHVRVAAQVLAMATLAKVENILSEKTMSVNNAMVHTRTTGTHGVPSICRVWTSVSEQHASMTTMFKHFKSHHTPSVEMFRSLSIPPSMEAIVVDCVPIVDPQLASIIRYDA
jgi:hypothetical protein